MEALGIGYTRSLGRPGRDGDSEADHGQGDPLETNEGDAGPVRKPSEKRHRPYETETSRYHV